MERAVGGEVKKVRQLRPDDSGHGIEGKIPGYTKEYGLEEFRKQRAPEQEISGRIERVGRLWRPRTATTR
jgi:hypothetical protein